MWPGARLRLRVSVTAGLTVPEAGSLDGGSPCAGLFASALSSPAPPLRLSSLRTKPPSSLEPSGGPSMVFSGHRQLYHPHRTPLGHPCAAPHDPDTLHGRSWVPP